MPVNGPIIWTLSLNAGAYTATVYQVTTLLGVLEVTVPSRPGRILVRDPVKLVNSQVVAGDIAGLTTRAQNSINDYIAAGMP